MRRLVSVLGMVGLLGTQLPEPAHGSGAPKDWLAVSSEELRLTDSTIEPGAASEYLFARSWTDDTGILTPGFRSTRDHYLRIKLYKEGGAERFATFDIYHYPEVKLSRIQARVVAPDGVVTVAEPQRTVREIVLRRGGDALLRESFAPPRLGPGCILEVRYREEATTDLAMAQLHLDALQLELPAREITRSILPAEAGRVRQMLLNTKAEIAPRDSDGRFITVARDVAASIEEPWSPPELQRRGWSVTYHATGSSSPRLFWTRVGESWSKRMERWTWPTPEMIELAHAMTRGAGGENEKIGSVARWVHSNFRVLQANDPDSASAAQNPRNRSAAEALAKRAGNAADANLLFIGLALAAGFEAHVLLAPDRSRIFFDQQILTEWALPGRIACVKVDGAWRAFDLGVRHMPWDMLPWWEEAQPALVCNRAGPEFFWTPNAQPERSKITRRVTARLAADGSLTGELSATYSGHSNRSMRTVLKDLMNDVADSLLLQRAGLRAGSARVFDPVLLRGDDPASPLEIRCRLLAEPPTDVEQDRLVLEPLGLITSTHSPFTASERRFPVCFDHAWSESDTIRFELPPQWRLEDPAPISRAFSDSTGALRWSVTTSADDTGLTLVRNLQVGSADRLSFPVTEYSGVKKFFDAVSEGSRMLVSLAARGARP